MNLVTIKNKLTAEKKLLEEELASLGIFDKSKRDWGAQSIPAADVDRSDDNTVADASEEYGERVAAVETLEFRLNEIKEALARIENSTFGKCLVCAAPIEEARLLANPAAKTCIAHKEKLQPKHIVNN